jgi:Flp pilus assembly protein protease CpaA
MTAGTVSTRPTASTRTTTVIAAAGSAILAVLAFPISSSTGYAWALTVLLTVAAAGTAVVDARTHKLPNRFVAPIAAAGVVQAAGLAVSTNDPARLLVPLAVAAIVFAVYTGMGLAGWFGFGDAKFAGALTVTVALYAGFAAVYIVAVAILLGALYRAFLLLRRRSAGAHPHGPAITISAITVMALAVLATYAK